MTISTGQYNEAAKHLIEDMQPEPMGTQELADRIKLIRKTLFIQPCALDAINQLVDLVAEAHKLVLGSVEMQDAYTKMQEQASGHTHDVYTMPLEREFIAKAAPIAELKGTI